jgi:hypothetical protein
MSAERSISIASSIDNREVQLNVNEKPVVVYPDLDIAEKALSSQISAGNVKQGLAGTAVGVIAFGSLATIVNGVLTKDLGEVSKAGSLLLTEVPATFGLSWASKQKKDRKEMLALVQQVKATP